MALSSNLLCQRVHSDPRLSFSIKPAFLRSPLQNPARCGRPAFRISRPVESCRSFADEVWGLELQEIGRGELRVLCCWRFSHGFPGPKETVEPLGFTQIGPPQAIVSGLNVLDFTGCSMCEAQIDREFELIDMTHVI